VFSPQEAEIEADPAKKAAAERKRKEEQEMLDAIKEAALSGKPRGRGGAALAATGRGRGGRGRGGKR
jgi:hypothetical protein